MIILTCGHEVSDFAHAYDIIHKGWASDGSRAMSYSTVCGPCEDRYRQHGDLFDTQQQAEEWIQDENS